MGWRRRAVWTGAILVAVVAAWLVPNPLTPCGSWRSGVNGLVDDWSRFGRGASFDSGTEMDEAEAYLDGLFSRAERLGEDRPPLCPVPGSVDEMRDEGSGLVWLLLPDEAPPGVFDD